MATSFSRCFLPQTYIFEAEFECLFAIFARSSMTLNTPARIMMPIPGWSLTARTSKVTFGFQPKVFWALLLSPCRKSCWWMKGDNAGEKERKINSQDWACASQSLSLSRLGRRRRSGILAAINPSRGFLTTVLSRPPCLCQTVWAMMNCGTLVVQLFQPPPAGFCPGFNIQIMPASVKDAKNKVLFRRMRFWPRLTEGETSGRLQELW